MNLIANKRLSRLSPWVMGAIVLVFLHRPLELLFSTILVDPILAHIESSVSLDIAAIALLIFILTFAGFKPPKYYLANSFVFIISVISFGYLWHRTWGKTWNFTSFYNWPGLYYADLMLIFTITFLFLWIRSFFSLREPLPSKSFFNNDSPLTQSGEDLLGYKAYATQIAQGIIRSGFDQSYAIGINAKWGMGKTSFLNMIKENLAHQDFIVIEFNAWQSNGSKSLLQEFFKSIENALTPFSLTLQYKIGRYGRKLKDVNDNTLSQIANVIIDIIYPDEELKQLHEDINEALKKINRKLIIFIDDVDRLGTEEVIELVRLIRNTANFHNTFFVVAYDRSYILKALAVNNIYNHEEFLEKIFQIEVHLPGFEKMELIAQLNRQIASGIPDSMQAQFEEAIYSRGFSQVNLLHEWLVSIRDVNRLSNALVLNFSRLQKEIDLIDFLHLELLRIKYPAVYDLLYKRNGDFLQLKSDGDRTKKFSLIPENGTTKFYKYIAQYYEELCLPKSQIPKVQSLVNRLFDNNSNHLSISNPDRFEIYFAYQIVDKVLPESEFIEFLKKGGEELNAKLQTWVEGKLETQLMQRFSLFNKINSKDEFEKLILGIFYFANLPTAFPIFSRHDHVGYDNQDLLIKLNLPDKKIPEWYQTKDKYKDFLLSIFTADESLKPYQAKFLEYVANDSSQGDSWFLSREQIESNLLDYLEKVCGEEGQFNRRVLYYYTRCMEKQPVQEIPGGTRLIKTPMEKAKNILINFIFTKAVDSFLLFSIEKNVFEDTYGVNNVPTMVWDNWSEFQSQLKTIDSAKSTYLSEYLDFLEKWIGNAHQSTKFQFVNIPTSEIGPR